MIQLLSAGVAHQVGGCTNAGRPVVCRGLAAQHEAGRLLVIISAESGFEVLDAIRQNGSIAVNVTLPENYRSHELHRQRRRGARQRRRLAPAGRRAARGLQRRSCGATESRPNTPMPGTRRPMSTWSPSASRPRTARNQTPGPGAGKPCTRARSSSRNERGIRRRPVAVRRAPHDGRRDSAGVVHGLAGAHAERELPVALRIRRSAAHRAVVPVLQSQPRKRAGHAARRR